MAKKQTKTNRKNVRLYALLKLSPLILIGLFVLYIICNSLYNSYLDQKDKEHWESVKSDVQKLQEELKVKTGLNWEFGAGCSQGSVKFQEPLRSCSVAVKTWIAPKSESQVKGYIDATIKILESNDKFTQVEGTTYRPSSFPKNLTPGSAGGGAKHLETNIACSYFFEIPVMDKRNLQKDPKLTILTLSFRCGDYSRKLYDFKEKHEPYSYLK